MSPSLLAFAFHSLEPHISFPQGAVVNEQIVLRWFHFVSGFIWIGTLYFLNLVGNPTMKQLDASVRVKIYPVMMSRAMAWVPRGIPFSSKSRWLISRVTRRPSLATMSRS